MSIVVPSDRGSWWCAKGPCFYCKTDIATDQVMVMWAGVGFVEYEEHEGDQGVDIALHIDCAERLGMHLIGDSREARLSAGEGVWKTRAGTLRKFQLERQEGLG